MAECDLSRADRGAGDVGADDRIVPELFEISCLQIQSPVHQQLEGSLLRGEMSLESCDGRGGDTAYPSLSPPVSPPLWSRPLSPDQPER
jgi:hypothetical protein